MRISNFVPLYVNEHRTKQLARVTVTTGILWWRQEKVRHIHSYFSGSWCFSDTGEWIPSKIMAPLERAFEGQQLLNEYKGIQETALIKHHRTIQGEQP